MDETYKSELIATAIKARRREVTEYQVNIDNYRMAIERIKDDADMKEFKKQLENLLSASVREQKKAQIMLDALQLQLK
jgi:hypothetical protein